MYSAPSHLCDVFYLLDEIRALNKGALKAHALCSFENSNY